MQLTAKICRSLLSLPQQPLLLLLLGGGADDAGHVDCAALLMEGGSSVSADCDGSPCLHLAVCSGALPGREGAALQLVQLLLDAGADPMQRSDQAPVGRLFPGPNVKCSGDVGLRLLTGSSCIMACNLALPASLAAASAVLCCHQFSPQVGAGLVGALVAGLVQLWCAGPGNAAGHPRVLSSAVC